MKPEDKEKRMYRTITIGLLLLAAAAPANAEMLLGDAARGRTTYETNCQGCHDSSVFTRPDRRIHSLEGLIKQVEFCNTQLKRRLSDGDLNDIVKYLDDSFYHFP
jgi:hypothetical protein